MSAWYRTGTASITNGAAAVTGSTTAWASEVKVGDSITFDGGDKWYEITAVNSNTSLTIGSNFGETTVSGGDYAIDRRALAWADPTEVALALATYLSALPADPVSASAGVFTAAAKLADGSAAAPALTFTNDPDTGIYRISANVLGFATGGIERFRVNGDGRLSVTGQLRGETLSSGILVIADDVPGTITPPMAGGFLAVMQNDASFAQAQRSGILAFDTGSTPNLITMGIGSGMTNTGSTTLSGTTGADGQISVSAQAGSIQIENRTGGLVIMTYTFLGSLT